MNLTGRTAIVTGGGNGLGRSHAMMLAKLGAKVVVNDKARDNAEAVVDELRASGAEAIACVGSVIDEAGVAAMVDGVMSKWGRIDILVNNAGILRDKTFAKMDLDDFRLVLDVHLMGAVICTKAVWEIMRQQRYGRVVMTTSSSGLYGNFGQSNYGAAKMALVGLMQTLALEGEKYDIRVNCLAPTAATQMTDGLLPPEALERLSPAYVSNALLALVHQNAPTRSILCAGGGHFAHANITLTDGAYIGGGEHAPQKVIENWDRIANRQGEVVPPYGFMQFERELESAARGAEA
ncbi:SDR family NAD(P)-dependent oxidoreductase [Agrobacterium sp. a22-2]|nr:SDR family NAD(P)-dependent oxidoreductase [Agrobacterium sp. a22-2]NKN39773.1 SDR family NAD(P)-dependent oxidoreductase [Agrobacterium sp. a22-2]